jgi:hypothetical protein
MILRNPLERDSVMLSGATLIVLAGASAQTEDLARNFLNTLPSIDRFLKKNDPPFIAKLYRPSHPEGMASGKKGDIRMILTFPEWEQMHR